MDTPMDTPATTGASAENQPVAEAAFRTALRHFASGVTVITTRAPDGGVHGMTATAFSSLSLEPPLVLVAVGRSTRCHRQILAQRRFGVSILGTDQAKLSRHFGGRPSAEARPAFDTLNGVPVLAGSLVRLACRLQERLEGGDHSIFVGFVTAAETGDGAPLVHFDGRYHGLAPHRSG